MLDPALENFTNCSKLTKGDTLLFLFFSNYSSLMYDAQRFFLPDFELWNAINFPRIQNFSPETLLIRSGKHEKVKNPLMPVESNPHPQTLKVRLPDQSTLTLTNYLSHTAKKTPHEVWVNLPETRSSVRREKRWWSGGRRNGSLVV